MSPPELTDEKDEKDEMKEDESREDEGITIDEMVKYVGEFKLFQGIVGAMFCIMMIPSTFQILMMEFTATNPNWRCVNGTECMLNGTQKPVAGEKDPRCGLNRTSWEYTVPDDYSIVSTFDIYCTRSWIIELAKSIIFVGSLVGSVLTGWVADNFGRKTTMFISMATIIVLGFVNAFVDDLVLLLIFRFVIGLFIPGTNIQMTVLLSEMTGERYRPLSGTLPWTFFPIALCLMSWKGYLVRKWKTFFIICSIPYLPCLLFYFFVPESVRWLRLHGKSKQLMAVFQRIAQWNSKTIPSHLRIRMTDPASTHHNRKSTPLDLVRSRKVMKVNVIQGFSLFMHGLVYFGIYMAADNIGVDFYLSFFLLSLIEVPAGFFSIYLCHLGRKISTITGVVLSGTSCIVLAIIPMGYGVARMTVAMLGKFCIACSFNTVALWEIELYPTSVRSQGMGLLNILARIGAGSAPWIVEGMDKIHSSAAFIMMGVTALASCSLQILLPETKGMPTLEVVTVSDPCLIGEEEMENEPLSK